jgi:phenylacetate-CoA ligase
MLQSLYRHVLIPAFESVWHRRGTFRYLRELEQSQWQSLAELEALQFERLRNLMSYTWQHCPYYRRTWEELGLQPDSLTSVQDLSRWPLVTRETIRAHRQEMRSSQSGLKRLSKSTGGSTGEPLHFDVCLESHERRTAASYRGYGWAGGHPGTKQFYLWGVPLGNRNWRQRSKDNIYNAIHRRHVFSTFSLARNTFREAAKQLSRYRPDAIVAYTTSLYVFAGLLEEAGIRPFSPKSIIVGAEKLHSFQRERIERVFQAPVFETYGSREFMLIGSECELHSGLHLTMENHVVEVVDDDGQPTSPGEEGNVVVTDLTNRGMPFIRYLNGDRAVAGWTACQCGRGLPLLRQVTGRRADVIVTPDGRSLTGLFFPHLLKDYAAIERYQVVQEAIDQLEVRLVVNANWSTSAEQSLRRQLATTLGSEMDAKIKCVTELPLTSQGKQQVVVNRLPSDVLAQALSGRCTEAEVA